MQNTRCECHIKRIHNNLFMRKSTKSRYCLTFSNLGLSILIASVDFHLYLRVSDELIIFYCISYTIITRHL